MTNTDVSEEGSEEFPATRNAHARILHKEQVGVRNAQKPLNLTGKLVVSKQLYKQAFLLLCYLDTNRREKIKDGRTLTLLIDTVNCYTLA